MGITIGNSTNGGWSTITPKADSSFSSWSAQFGDAYNGDGTRIVFVNSSTGSDSNHGTLASPYLTITKGVSQLRSAKPDWVLIRNGTTYTEGATVFAPVGSGVSFSGSLSTFFPVVIASYDAGAANNPPVPNPGTGGARPVHTVGPTGAAFVLKDGFALLGIEMYCPYGDPTNSLFNGGECSAVNTPDGTTFFLGEDNKVNGFQHGFTISLDPTNAAAGQAWIRRNIFINTQTITDRSNALTSAAGTPYVLEQNLFDTTGWYTPQPVSITAASPGVFHWTTSLPDASGPSGAGWDGTSDENGGRIKVYAAPGSTLPSPLDSSTVYFITNGGIDGTRKFRLATSVGGSDINTSGGSGSTFYAKWADFDGGSFCHAFYLDGVTRLNDYTTVAPYTVNENIVANNSRSGDNIRNGGYITNNTYINSRNGHNTAATVAGISNTVKNNVHQGGGTAFQTQSTEIYNYDHYSLSGIDVSRNIMHNSLVNAAPFMSIGRGFDNVSMHDNYFYNFAAGTAADNVNGSIKTFSINAAGSGGTGAIVTLDSTHLGTQTANGTAGTYTNVALIGGAGSGATVDITVNADHTVHIAGGCPPYVGDLTAWGGGVKLNAAGTGYSTGDVLTVSNGNIPSGFHIVVGPYPDSTDIHGHGLALTNFSGSMAGSNGEAWISFSGGHATAATVFFSEIDYNGGANYTVGDVCTIPTVQGISGIKLNVTISVTNNPEANNTIKTPAPTDVSLGAYYGSFGGSPATTGGFLAAAATQSKASWDSRLTAAAYNAYVRTAFGILDTPPPVLMPQICM